jgi:hypothetical protein
MTPAQEFRSFVLSQLRGLEVLSPTLLKIKLDLLVRQELNFARQSHTAGQHGDNFSEWYNGAAKEEEIKKELKAADLGSDN